MRHYELVVVLSPMLNQEQSTDAWGRIKDFISNRSAEITHEEKWGTRRLAYPIRKGSYQFLEGSYHLTRFSTESPFNRELATFLRLDDQVLRSLVVVAQPPGAEPAPAVVRAPAAVAEPVAEAPGAVEEPVAEALGAVEEPVAEAADEERPEGAEGTGGPEENRA